MTYSEHQLAVMSARKYNILPVTSVCNLSCVFCSHQGNPPQVQTFSTGHRPLEEIKELISFLQAGQKIVIGESLTKIEEGEPFIHPQFEKIIDELRANFPETLIKVTTNGTKLTPAKVDLLTQAEPIELNVSLNSASLAGRKKLMKDQTKTVLTGIKRLQERGIIYHGSIVAMPQIVGWSNVEETIAYLDQHKAQTIRIFLPGYTRFSPAKIKFKLSLWDDLEEFVRRMQDQYPTPITLEPARIKELTAQIEGVIAGFPAAKAGLQPKDEIIAINQEPVFSRVDAFNRLLKSKDPQVKVKRQTDEKSLTLNKEIGAKSGIVVDYDVDPSLLLRINQIINSRQAQNILVLTSQLAELKLQQAFSFLPDKWNLKIKAVPNSFFGGSIMNAGLLTVDDFRQMLDDYSSQLAEFDLVLLPETAFDFAGCDLVGEHYRQLQEEFGINLEIIN